MSRPPPSPCDADVAMFGGAAARGAIFELRARMFVDVIPELSGSITLSLDPLIKRITEWMEREGRWSSDDRELLKRAARIRNKLFHAELSRAAGQLVSLDVELGKEGVKMFAVDGTMTAEKLFAAIETGGVDVGTTRTDEGRVFGWVLHAAQTGAFGAAGRVFEQATELLVQVLWDWTQARMERDRDA